MVDLLSYYQLYPTKIKQITKSLYKIEANGSTFALKKSSLTKETVPFFEQIYHIAFSKELVNFIPVYLTIHRKLYLEYGEAIYYLTPWFETKQQKNRYGLIFQVLGKIHYETKQVSTISNKELIISFQSYQTACQKQYKKLESFIAIFEEKRYMAPFELQVCTQFHHMEQLFKKIDQYLERLIEAIEKEHKWSYSLCHGDFHDNHVLQTPESLYVINWEQASFSHPMIDIVSYYKQACSHYSIDEEALLGAFHLYMEKNELQLNELYYILIYLLDPKDYMQVVESYLLDYNTNQLELIMGIERIFRVLLFGLKWEQLFHEYRNQDEEIDETTKSTSDEKQ